MNIFHFFFSSAYLSFLVNDLGQIKIKVYVLFIAFFPFMQTKLIYV